MTFCEEEAGGGGPCGHHHRAEAVAAAAAAERMDERKKGNGKNCDDVTYRTMMHDNDPRTQRQHSGGVGCYDDDGRPTLLRLIPPVVLLSLRPRKYQHDKRRRLFRIISAI